VARVLVTVGGVGKDRIGLHRGYTDALTRLGHQPLLLPPDLAQTDDVESAAKELLGLGDALLLTGGGDVDPAAYGRGTTSSRIYGVDRSRDELETALVVVARRQGMRVLAICRGIQILNVALGGTLIADLEESGYENHSLTEREYDYAHPITIEPSSTLANVLPGVAMANSLHHQAIEEPAPDLEVVARSPDGVIEAVEAEGVLGVQWHPERLIDSEPIQLNLFRWLTDSR
jgi:putative glutamine amidotransferase